MATNGHYPAATIRSLKPGVWAPIPTFFEAGTEDLGNLLFSGNWRPLTHSIDIASFKAHVARVAKAGVWPLIAGSMGEAIHLSVAERTKLIQTARQTLDAEGLVDVPIIAGTGGASTRETIQLTHSAAAAGADYSIVIASGYFAGALASNRAALKAFFVEVAEKSPIPVMIYNCNFILSVGGRR